ncbi:MAG TPA: glycosyltransferase, partial [Legionellaceae bacterium]|nr:glycosyltransferase [Legionellaceae bacterium]
LAHLTHPFWSWIERWTITQAKQVNLISRGFQHYIETHYPHIKLSYFTHGIHKDLIQYSFKSVGQSSDQFTVLYAGEMNDEQGLECILPKLAKLLEGCANFKIWGEGKRKKHVEMAVQLAQCSNVEFLSLKNRYELLATYEQADILFLHINPHHCWRNTLPSNLFEYAATGKPIWAGAQGYVAEFIRTEIDNAIVFSPGDAEKAVKDIVKLQFGVYERLDFLRKYQQDNLLQTMANELIAYIQQ